jgi:hypothetical protein
VSVAHRCSVEMAASASFRFQPTRLQLIITISLRQCLTITPTFTRPDPFSFTTLTLFNYHLFSNMDDIPSSYIFVALIIATFLTNASQSCIKACLAERLDIPEEYFRYNRLRCSNEVRLLRLHAGAPWERLDRDIIQCP